MNPRLALILCTIFVLFLLRLERRISQGVSLATWIPTVWLMTIYSKPLSAWFGVIGSNKDGSTLDELLLTSLNIAAFVVLARRRFDWQGVLRRHAWLLVLLAYMLASTIWSDISLVALRRWLRESIILTMALVIASESNPRLAMESVLRRFAYVLLPFSLILVKYYPPLGVAYSWSGVQMWIGVTLHKNALGSLCLMSALFLLWARFRQWRERATVRGRWVGSADLLIVFIAFLLVSGAQKNSATATASFAAACVTFLSLRWFQKMRFRIPRAALLMLVISLVSFGVAGPFLQGANVASFTSNLGRDATLTGRTDVWVSVMPKLIEQPLLGYGFGSFWTDERRTLYEISDSHNGYLDTLLELGVLGFAIYMGWLLSYARKLHHAIAKDYNWAGLAISCLVMTLIYNAAESTLNSLIYQITVFPVLMSFVLAGEPVRESRQSHIARFASPMHDAVADTLPTY